MNLFEMRGGLARSRTFGDVALYLAAAFPLLLALVLFLTLALLSPAHAADAKKCDGSNILGSLQASDPARYEAVLDEGAGIVNGKGVFWKIEKPGLEPSWLMGTMHLTDPRVLSMPDAARPCTSRLLPSRRTENLVPSTTTRPSSERTTKGRPSWATSK